MFRNNIKIKYEWKPSLVSIPENTVLETDKLSKSSIKPSISYSTFENNYIISYKRYTLNKYIIM